MAETSTTATGISVDPRLPVLVGVGVASQALEPAELMTEALRAAVLDAGVPSLAAVVDRIAVPQGTWTYPDPARLVADRIGAVDAETHLVELGIPQQSLINGALAAILAGTSDIAVVVGGEAKRYEREAARSGADPVETAQSGVVPDVVHRRSGPLLEPVEVAHRLWDPVLQYALIENALRASDGCSIDAHRAEIAALWSRCNQVAHANPDAAFPAPLGAAEIDTPGPGNRPLAFPYNKWHVSQWTVDQAAALVFCSVERARELGIDPDRWIFPLVAIESSHALSLLKREELAAWPAMAVLGESAARRLGRPLADLDLVEVYSCFPAAVRVQQRALGLDRDGTPTLTGGMAFAGGPFNNYVLQSLVAMVPRLRSAPDTLGMVTTVSGLLTKPGIGVWSARPDGAPPLLADLAFEARAATGALDVVETLDGSRGGARVATYTVTYDGSDPVRTVVLCDTDDGRRAVAVRDDPDLARHAVSHELIGAKVDLGEGSFEPV